jgi:hypothetical protein
MDGTNGLKETTRVSAPVALGGQSVVVDVRLPAAITSIDGRCECFIAHGGGSPLVGKVPEIAVPKYRAIP